MSMSEAGEATVASKAFDLPNDFVDRFLDGNGGESEGTGGVEETERDEIDQDQESEEDDAGSLGDNESGEEGGSAGADESDEQEDEPDEEDEDEEDEGKRKGKEEDTFLSEANLKKHQERIEKDPSLRAVYREMQADYTRKTMRVAEAQREFETKALDAQEAEAEYNFFAERLMDVTEGGGREKFLLDAALDNPAVFQRAFDRAAELLESPEAKSKYEREREVDRREQEIAARERTDAARVLESRIREIHAVSERYCDEFGIKSQRGIALAKRYVADMITENRQATGKPTITERQIRLAVKEAAEALGEAKKQGAEETKRQVRLDSLNKAKASAKNAKRTPPPSGKRLPASGANKKPIDKDKLPPNVDPLDARLDQLLAG